MEPLDSVHKMGATFIETLQRTDVSIMILRNVLPNTPFCTFKFKKPIRLNFIGKEVNECNNSWERTLLYFRAHTI